jgi:hypothetical protein
MPDHDDDRAGGIRGLVHRILHAPMVDTALAVISRPMLPLSKRMHLHRWRPRRYRPDHVLVPDGYEVEVVATGFHEPVHCCFDDAGNCYVIECGHKIEAKPRVLKVDVETGDREVVFELPEERWIMTGAVMRKFPDLHDVPGQDIVLTGRNYTSPDVLDEAIPTSTVETGAYVPFGTRTEPGQVIKGDVKASGSVLRCNPDGSDLELVAWGLRNPYGIAFHPDGRLFATEHGIDERGSRHIIGDHEDLYEITEGAWYGWPDFASGIRLDDPS